MPITVKGIFLLLSSGLALWMLHGKETGDRDVGYGKFKQRWQIIAEMKTMENMAKIPPDWLLPEDVLEEGKNRRKIAGDFIENLLDPETKRITGMDNVEILDLVRKGSLTAVQVTTAFCKRGAYAHQLVRGFPPLSRLLETSALT